MSHPYRYKAALLVVPAAAAFLALGGCLGVPTDSSADSSSLSRRTFPLESLNTATITANEHEIRVWVVKTPDTREEGLMFVPENAIADDQGMLFVFPTERYLGFWMKNTITSLDIAFARLDGTIVATHTMPPLTLSTFPSIEPAIFALEMKAGSFERLGIKEGDRLIISDDIFKDVE